MRYGPREKNNDISVQEQLEITEAYQEAQEYLETGFSDSDFIFDEDI